MNVSQLSAELRRRLASQSDARGIERELMHHIALLRPVDIVVNPERELPDFVSDKILRLADEIANGRPVQYALGRARFYGMDLAVGPGVLIPRPETAELVDIIADRYSSRRDLRIIDLGTGSGAIAIALARTLPFADITAIDISDQALAFARQNANEQRAGIRIEKADILTYRPTEYFDIVVSNPPYVLSSERAEMAPRVLDHEPELALFVPDGDPLRFYSAILRNFAGKAGAFYFEINPLEYAAYKNAEIVRDSFGKLRFAIYDPATNAPTSL